jgi:DDE superfamily endonuclease
MRLSGCAAMPMPPFPLARLGHFRAELHACFTRRADALFELGDALLCAQAVPSLPHLSLEPVCRRGWGSAYAGLSSGRIDAERLRDLLVDCLPSADPLVFAVDVITWPRCDAECSPQRGYYYHPSRHSAGQPIVAGWAWQWIAQLGFDRDSWTTPVDARRLHPMDDTDQTAAGQIRALVGRLDAGGRLGRCGMRTRSAAFKSRSSSARSVPVGGGDRAGGGDRGTPAAAAGGSPVHAGPVRQASGR